KTIFDARKPLYRLECQNKCDFQKRHRITLYQHVLHSLAIAKVHSFEPKTAIMDVGTGGGFPGIPLAIMFPETQFYLIDTIGKKIKVVQEVITALGLKNAKAEQKRAENVTQKFDFIVSRA